MKIGFTSQLKTYSFSEIEMIKSISEMPPSK